MGVAEEEFGDAEKRIAALGKRLVFHDRQELRERIGVCVCVCACVYVCVCVCVCV